MGRASKRSSVQPGGVSSSSLDRLYRLYAPWLTARIRRRFGGDAEDIVQETYIRVGPSLHEARILNPKALLMQVASNVAIDEVRRRQRHNNWTETQQTPPDMSHSSGWEQEEVVRLKQLIRSLSPKLRQVLLLSRFGGLTNHAIAERLDLPLKTVEWRLSKAMIRCAAMMRD